MGFPESGGVFSANDGSRSSPIKHLLSGRIVIEPLNLPLDRRVEFRFTATHGGRDFNINPGPAQLTVHRKVRRDVLARIIIEWRLIDSYLLGIRHSDKPNCQRTD